MICVSKPSKIATVVQSVTISTWKRLSRAPRTIALISTSPRSLIASSPCRLYFLLVDQVIARLAFDRRRARIEGDAGRIAALRDDLGLFQEKAAQHDDALIGGREMLVGMQRDRALAGLRLVIVG